MASQPMQQIREQDDDKDGRILVLIAKLEEANAVIARQQAELALASARICKLVEAIKRRDAG